MSYKIIDGKVYVEPSFQVYVPEEVITPPEDEEVKTFSPLEIALDGVWSKLKALYGETPLELIDVNTPLCSFTEKGVTANQVNDELKQNLHDQVDEFFINPIPLFYYVEKVSETGYIFCVSTDLNTLKNKENIIVLG